MSKSCPGYERHRFPLEITAHAVWLYYRFPLSLRLVEEMLLERGLVVSFESIRRWERKFGPEYVRSLQRILPKKNDIRHLDDGVARQGFAKKKPERVVLKINGKKHWLWRAVDQEGCVLDEIVQTRRDTKAARKNLRGPK